MRCRITLVALFVFVAGAANTALADDIHPPPWRGSPLTTVAEWDFRSPNPMTPPDGLLPTVVGNSGGGPLANIGGGLIWDPVFNGSWIGNTGGQIRFEIPNWIDNEPVKFLQIQTTYQPNPQFPFPGVVVIVAGDPQGIGGVFEIGEVDVPIDPLNNLWHKTERWEIYPNPDWEHLIMNVPPDTVVTQVVIDTWSVPEPSTLWLAGIGATFFALLAWRRRS